ELVHRADVRVAGGDADTAAEVSGLTVGIHGAPSLVGAGNPARIVIGQHQLGQGPLGGIVEVEVLVAQIERLVDHVDRGAGLVVGAEPGEQVDEHHLVLGGGA